MARLPINACTCKILRREGVKNSARLQELGNALSHARTEMDGPAELLGSYLEHAMI